MNFLKESQLRLAVFNGKLNKTFHRAFAWECFLLRIFFLFCAACVDFEFLLLKTLNVMNKNVNFNYDNQYMCVVHIQKRNR